MKIVVDTREVQGWTFSFFMESTVRQMLDVGDYAIHGRENVVRIERKASVGELSANFTSGYQRFKVEFERAKHIGDLYLICEFPYDYILTFPVNSGIPKSKWSKLKTKPEQIIHKLKLFEERYGLKQIFCNNREEAEGEAYRILKSYDNR